MEMFPLAASPQDAAHGMLVFGFGSEFSEVSGEEEEIFRHSTRKDLKNLCIKCTKEQGTGSLQHEAIFSWVQ